MYWTHVLNLLFSIVTASFFLMRRAAIILHKLDQNAKLEGTSNEEKELIHMVQQYCRSVSWFIITAGVLLAGGYIVLYLFQEEIIRILGFPEIMHSSGLMTLCLLFLISAAIRLFYAIISRFLKLGSLNPDEAKTIIFLLSVLLNLCFLLFDPGTGVYISVLILGKLIWIDSIYDFDSLKQSVSVLIGEYRESDLTAGAVSLEYAKGILLCFCMCEITCLFLVSMIADNSINQMSIVFPIYIVISSMLSIQNSSMESIYDMDTLQKTAEYLKKQKEQSDQEQSDNFG